jgi:N-acetylglucosaminyldiphosphoundecaprenol N-acetyl-beta-D-mannosaminyltransferase
LIDRGKRSVLGVNVNVIDYDCAVKQVIQAAASRRPLAATALAVHGVMTGRLDPIQRFRLNQLALVLPDGQPVRWALALIHGERLTSRVYGPDLMLYICAEAAREDFPIFLYGSKPDVLEQLKSSLCQRFPALRVAGALPSRFRQLSDDENRAAVETIRQSGARITFVGLGCPRQETWAFENTEALGMPVLAVGAAFDFHAGLQPQAPAWMQRHGLEWLYRLSREPRRLWRRYLLLNPLFCANLVLQFLYPARFEGDEGIRPPGRVNFG